MHEKQGVFSCFLCENRSSLAKVRKHWYTEPVEKTERGKDLVRRAFPVLSLASSAALLQKTDNNRSERKTASERNKKAQEVTQ